MLQKLTSGGDDRVVAFKWDGEFTEAALKQCLVDFMDELRARSRMNLYLEVANLGKVEPKALWEDIKFSIKNIKEITDKIDKVALVTDIEWLRTLIGTSGKLTPKTEIKTYSFINSDKAIIWVNEPK